MAAADMTIYKRCSNTSQLFINFNDFCICVNVNEDEKQHGMTLKEVQGQGHLLKL